MKNFTSRFNTKFKIVAALTLFTLLCVIFFARDNVRCIYWKYFKDIHCVSSSAPSLVRFLSDSLYITADYYKPQNSNTHSILVLHGSSSEARKAPIIRALGAKFSELGYQVLAIDHRGYGNSQKPRYLSVDNFYFGSDAENGIDYLIKELNADPSRIFVIGHSFGAGVALTFAAKDSRVKKIVLFGPPRRLEERFFSENAKDRKYFLERWQKDMNLTYELEFNIWKDVYQNLDLQKFIPLLKSNDHIPVFLIDGEMESGEDKEFLKNIFLQSNPPIDYWTVPSSNHYLNVKIEDEQLVYEGTAVKDFVIEVNKWLIN